jgi:hypothetical protein
MTTDIKTITRFKKLFRGNPQAYGVFWSKNGKSETIRKPPTLDDYEAHLYGDANGLGIVPVIDHNTSQFGVLDYDNHKQKDGVNLVDLEKAIKKLGAPLVVCRSKSGGAHVFLFGSKPLNTKVLRQTMYNYATQLSGFGEVEIEIFPKQDHVDKHLVGNWINLPYFTSSVTERYAIINGKKANLEQFLKEAENLAVDNTMLLELGSETHKDAPPCIEKMLKERLDEGSRNNALYSFSVYVKKAFPENWQNLVYKFNAENFVEPLKHDEVTKVINSVDRNENYRYKCGQEPCKSRCDSSRCVMRKWGITPTERSELMMSTLPEFGKLRKYLMDPVKYELVIEGKKVMLTSEDLLIFSRFRKVVFEQLDRVLKTIKPEVWIDIVDKMIKNVELIEVPDDASRNGLIRSLLMEYIKQANLEDSGKDVEKRKLLTSGHPVVQQMNENTTGEKKRYVLFKGVDFRRAIQSKRLGNLVGTDIWIAIKDMGVRSFTVRDKDRVLKVWGVPLINDTVHPDVYLDDFELKKPTLHAPSRFDEVKDRLEETVNINPEIDYSKVPDDVEDMGEFKPEF